MGRLHHFFEERGAIRPFTRCGPGAHLGPVSSSTVPMEMLPAFERSADGAYAVDFDQRIVSWNRSAERLLGYRAPDVLGKRCYDLIAGGDHSGHPFCGPDCAVIECARRGKAMENYDVRTRTAAGKSVLINISIVVLAGRSKRSTLTVHLFREITERRRKEMRLRRELSQSAAPQEPDGKDQAGARLTRREMEVLGLMASGLSAARIADVLCVSRTTVRNHIEHLLAKLGVHSKLEAVVYAARHGLV